MTKVVWNDISDDELTGMLVELHGTGTRVPFLELGKDIIIIIDNIPPSHSYYEYRWYLLKIGTIDALLMRHIWWEV